jgi:hypothetical protein
MSRLWQASYARGVRLSKAGCSLPYLHTLPGRGSFYQRAVYVDQVRGYFQSCAINFGEAAGYVIALRVGTDHARGAIVTSYVLNPPWPDDEIQWGYHPEDLLSECSVYDYRKLLESNLPGFLAQRRLLSRGRPVEGLLCGFSWNPIPELYLRRKSTVAEIVVVEDSGRRACSPLRLAILKSELSADVKERLHNRLRFFDEFDDVPEEDVNHEEGRST